MNTMDNQFAKVFTYQELKSLKSDIPDFFYIYNLWIVEDDASKKKFLKEKFWNIFDHFAIFLWENDSKYCFYIITSQIPNQMFHDYWSLFIDHFRNSCLSCAPFNKNKILQKTVSEYKTHPEKIERDSIFIINKDRYTLSNGVCVFNKESIINIENIKEIKKEDMKLAIDEWVVTIDKKTKIHDLDIQLLIILLTNLKNNNKLSGGDRHNLDIIIKNINTWNLNFAPKITMSLKME